MRKVHLATALRTGTARCSQMASTLISIVIVAALLYSCSCEEEPKGFDDTECGKNERMPIRSARMPTEEKLPDQL
ncbi:hypothetical protein COOONC_09403 [Cooperia oncophora]